MVDVASEANSEQLANVFKFLKILDSKDRIQYPIDHLIEYELAMLDLSRSHPVAQTCQIIDGNEVCVRNGKLSRVLWETSEYASTVVV